MKYKISIVENSRPVHLVEPVWNGDNIFELSITQIVAWRVEYSEEGEHSFATPVTVDAGLSDTYAIYDSDLKKWTIPESTTGEGLDTLLEHFKSNNKS